MRMRSARHVLMALATPLLAIVISVFVLGGFASAHVVTSITADCYLVTVHFSDFPEAGVMVHIAADVNGQTVSSDVRVTNTTSEAHLDISAATAALGDTPANIDVDVTWTYLGPQHMHKTLTATCGTPTTTTSSTTPTQAIATTTSPAAPTTTIPATMTTTVPPTTTSTQVLGTTVIATTTAPPTTTKGTVVVQGATAAPTTTTAPAIATLPFTGSNPAFPLMFGLSSLIAGALLLLRQRRTSDRTNDDWGPAT